MTIKKYKKRLLRNKSVLISIREGLYVTPMNKYINVNISNLQKIVRQSFEQRRKKIKTSLKDYSHLLRKYKIDDDLRAENLSVDDDCKLA